ncbi:MAG: ArgR family transcriptional regulator [Gammaproteobacteria bacterium]|nr:ArgR family transcriptional regulator [Gammaproteobacteria bacterium]
MSHDHSLDNHILAIIQQERITEQAELQTHLQRRNLDIPQATVSRRLKKLNIAKIGGHYQCVTPAPIHLPLILKMDISDFGLLILHTAPGQASSVAFYLDQKYVAGVAALNQEQILLGTIAGDDTILLILKNQKTLELMRSELQKEFPHL